jgi:hypothetical protein
MHGTVAFEWTLGGAFLLETSSADDPAMPTGMILIGAEGDRYVQHYFDSRGVVRRYEMEFGGGVWKLWRDDDDFAQRFTATLSDDGMTMTGAFERTEDGRWLHDFDITYTRR